MSNSHSFIVATTLLLGGCAIPDPPPPGPNHPASPLAMEAPVTDRMNPLRSNEITNQTRKLLRQARQQDEKQNQDHEQMDRGDMKMH